MDPRSLRRHYPHQVQGVVQPDLSAIAAPPLCESRIRPELAKSTHRNCRASVSDARPIGSAFGTVTDAKQRPGFPTPYNSPALELVRSHPSITTTMAIDRVLALRWCEKWPSISHSPVSTRCLRCKCQRHPCHRTCLRSSPCTSQR